MLQSLLQPSRDSQRTNMIGALPAVAVRHERRRNEKRGGGRRPSQLPLQLGRPGDAETSPSPVAQLRNELYLCGKVIGVAALHIIVGTLLLGIVILVVGLVQLSPGAEAAKHRYYLMGTGGAMVGAGIFAAVVRCLCLAWINGKFCHDADDEDPEPPTHKHTTTVVSVVETHGQKSGNTSKSGYETKPDKPKLKSQGSVSVDTLIKQPSAASDT